MVLLLYIVCHGKPPCICQQVSVAVNLTSLPSNLSRRVSGANVPLTHFLKPFSLPTAYDARLVDIWACGIVYYCLHFGELPWRVAQQSDPLYATYAAACATSTTSCPPTINNLSPRACRPLLRRMLDPDPKRRCVIEEAVMHPWIQSIEVCTEVKNPRHVHVHAREVLQAHAAAAAATNAHT